MGVLVWILGGIIAGWLTGMVLHGSGYGLVGDIVLGVLGALVGGFLASAVFGVPDAARGFNVPSIIVAFVGGIIVVMVIRAIAKPTTIKVYRQQNSPPGVPLVLKGRTGFAQLPHNLREGRDER